MSSSSSTKRNLKPSPIAASLQQNSHSTTTELPSLQPAAPIATAGQDSHAGAPQPLASPTNRKRKSVTLNHSQEQMASSAGGAETQASSATVPPAADADAGAQEPRAKKSRTNTPWTPAEELRLKQMRDVGNSWSEIAKTFPQRTEGSVKKHWYKDMHYAEFAEDESTALLAAIKEYDANKWKVIGQKVGKPAKACEQYAKEHFGGKY
ncbi:Nn.00g011330.m01.CDS01 [Neocucurbitaria sp. VM-36]